MLYLVILFLLIGVFLFWKSGSQRKSVGLPGGKIVYSDTGVRDEVAEALYDPIWNLTGKPDYLVRQKQDVIPVEVKSGRTPGAPYDSHIFQVAAYCLLVEQVLGVRPSHGIIQYPQRKFRVDYTRELEEALKVLLEEIRTHSRKKQVNRSHDIRERCVACGFRKVCPERIS
jgi:CRISPR-associated exonuclease Cas4